MREKRSPSAAPDALIVESLSVSEQRVEALVRVPDRDLARTRAVPGLADRVLREYAGIVRHRCECGSEHGIAAELADTETAHMLEHVALELMVGMGAQRSLRGETRWDFATDGKGAFRVSIAYGTDAGSTSEMAEECIRRGADVLNRMIAELLTSS